MADRTKIEWTDASWTPVKGCSRASHGCINCYAEIMAARFSQPGMWGEGLAQIVTTPSGKDHRWAGVTRFDASELAQPLRWKKARRIFVCSTSDLFHESVPDEWIDQCFAIMGMCPQHTFQVLTKRADRMRQYLLDPSQARRVSDMVNAWPPAAIGHGNEFIADFRWLAGEPLPNVWLGVSVEDQQRALQRIPDLLATPAAIRWLSCEPLLDEIYLTDIADGGSTVLDPECWGDCNCSGLFGYDSGCRRNGGDGSLRRKIDWVVVGGESGSDARPMHPDWARSLRDQCAAAAVPFFFKQWGNWVPVSEVEGVGPHHHFPDGATVRNVGKKIAGRTLDGLTHDGMPEVSHG